MLIFYFDIVHPLWLKYAILFIEKKKLKSLPMENGGSMDTYSVY